MDHQDWRSVDVGRRSGGALTTEELALKERQAKRAGDSKTFKKYTGPSGGPSNAKKLDDATESVKIDKLKSGQDIMRGRAAKKITRKQLAGLVNKKEEVIASFENNTALATPQNKQLLNLIKRKLGI